MSKILLLGGTGATGKYLVDELALKGDEVFVTSRHSHEGREHVEYIVGDAHRLAFVRETIERVKPDAIVDFMVYSTPEFVDRYKFFLGAVKHYIFLSSYRVFAGNSPLDENSPRLLDVIQDEEYLMTDEYGLSKAREENVEPVFKVSSEYDYHMYPKSMMHNDFIDPDSLLVTVDNLIGGKT